MKRKSGNRKNPKPFAVQHKKDLGQHFLYDMELLRSLVLKSGVKAGDDVLEIGPGAGTLTRALCESGAQVVAVEVDTALLPNLIRMQEEFSNLTVIRSDIRKLNFNDLPFTGEFSVVANIPYSITTPIFDLFFQNNQSVRQMSVMVQKEVGDKLVAMPGDKAFGLMSLRAAYYSQPEIITIVPASAFTPPPKVDSAFVTLTFRHAPPLPVKNETLLWRLISASFAMRRKTMQNALKGVLPITAEAFQGVLESQGLSPQVRGETLSMEQWITLSNAIALESTRTHV